MLKDTRERKIFQLKKYLRSFSLYCIQKNLNNYNVTTSVGKIFTYSDTSCKQTMSYAMPLCYNIMLFVKSIHYL